MNAHQRDSFTVLNIHPAQQPECGLERRILRWSITSASSKYWKCE